MFKKFVKRARVGKGRRTFGSNSGKCFLIASKKFKVKNSSQPPDPPPTLLNRDELSNKQQQPDPYNASISASNAHFLPRAYKSHNHHPRYHPYDCNLPHLRRQTPPHPHPAERQGSIPLDSSPTNTILGSRSLPARIGLAPPTHDPPHGHNAAWRRKQRRRAGRVWTASRDADCE